VITNDVVNALDAGRRRRSPTCASALVLDRLALDEVTSAERTALFAHIAGCADCTAAQARLEADRQAFAHEAALPTLAADALARSQRKSEWTPAFWRRLLAPMAMLGAVAGISLFIGRPQLGNRTKGELSLSAYVLHPERNATGSLHAGEPLHPGDQLQFRYNGRRGGYLAIVAVDGGGRVSVYYPSGGTAAPVAAGHDVALSSAVELDGSLGHEVILGVRCDTPVSVQAIEAAARKAADSARARGAAPTELGALDLPCVDTRYRIEKQARPPGW
jgi:hypothetical protein